MANLKVAPETLTEVGASVSNGAVEVLEILGTLRARVAPLQDVWSGDAAAAFQVLFEQWGTGANQVQQALGGISELLKNAGTAYGDTESQLKGAFSIT